MGSSAIQGLGGGLLIQQRYTELKTLVNVTGHIPNDDSIPLITEGDKIMEVSITPTSVNTILKIDVCVDLTTSSGDHTTAALFQDATVNALSANIATTSAADYMNHIVFTHYMQSGTTSSTTFSVRVGANGANTYINGSSAGQYFDGVASSSITVSEVGLGIGGGGGITIQQVQTQDGEMLTGSTTIPDDDTIPQITEGNEFMTLAITPTSSNSILKIDVDLMCSMSTQSKIIGCLFKDSDVDALATASTFDNQTEAIQALSFSYIMTAGSTSPITFRVRAGSATAGTITFNGEVGVRNWGGTLASSIVITELGSGVGSMRSGQTVQVVNVQDGEVNTGATIMPFDDTVPQSTEGDEYMTLAITPTSATNKLKIDVTVQGDNGGAVFNTVALFQDATLNALACISDYEVNGRGGIYNFTHYMSAGTTSSTTFRVRVGGTSGTFTFNGSGSARKMGGTMASGITITEIAV